MQIEAEVLPPVTDIILAVEATPQIVLLDAKKFDSFYEKMKAETDKLVPDVSTKKGRDEIRSMANRVTTTKAAIEKDRLRLTADWREQVAKVNEAGKGIKERLEALATEVRAPLTAWEDEQKRIEEECRNTMDFLREAAIVTLGDTVETVRERGTKVFNVHLDEDVFGGLFDDATALKGIAMTNLKEALARLEKEAADQAELQRLRDLEATRVAEETARREREELEKAERERQEREAREAEQREKERAEAIARAAEEAAAKAKADADAEAQRKIDEANKRAAAAEQEAQAERQRIADAEAKRLAEEEAAKAEQAKREADQAHRTTVKTKAKEAIMSCGADEDTARKIVTLIIAGEVPHVSLKF